LGLLVYSSFYVEVVPIQQTDGLQRDVVKSCILLCI
jgi:hypothetical protein